MTQSITQTSPLSLARVAGFLYLSLVPLGFFGVGYVYPRLIVPGDIAATIEHIKASEALFRLNIVSGLLLQIINIFVVLALYRLLKPVSRNIALLMVGFILLAVPIAMLNQLNHFAVLILLADPAYAARFTAEQLQGLVSFFLDLHEHGVLIAGIFWGLWLFPMGYLVFKSGFLPRILGILLIIGCFGYLFDSFMSFLLPNPGLNIAIFTFWGEILLPLWLLIKGVNVERWEQRALESAK